MTKPRKPTNTELEQLRRFEFERAAMPHTDGEYVSVRVDEWVRKACVAVFEGVSSHGFVGQVMLVLWGVGRCSAYVWEDSELKLVDPEKGFSALWTDWEIAGAEYHEEELRRRRRL